MKKHTFATKPLSRRRCEIKAYSIGITDYSLAAELFAPLFMKIHNSNELTKVDN
jgi:hypothetical protein